MAPTFTWTWRSPVASAPRSPLAAAPGGVGCVTGIDQPVTLMEPTFTRASRCAGVSAGSVSDALPALTWTLSVAFGVIDRVAVILPASARSDELSVTCAPLTVRLPALSCRSILPWRSVTVAFPAFKRNVTAVCCGVVTSRSTDRSSARHQRSWSSSCSGPGSCCRPVSCQRPFWLNSRVATLWLSVRTTLVTCTRHLVTTPLTDGHVASGILDGEHDRRGDGEGLCRCICVAGHAAADQKPSDDTSHQEGEQTEEQKGADDSTNEPADRVPVIGALVAAVAARAVQDSFQQR